MITEIKIINETKVDNWDSNRKKMKYKHETTKQKNFSPIKNPSAVKLFSPGAVV